MQLHHKAARVVRARNFILTLTAMFVFVLTASVAQFHATAFAEADKTRRAQVIVQLDDRDVLIRDITFQKRKTSGFDALLLTGLNVVWKDTQFGPAVCAIQGVGMPADNCFGDPQGRYWSYRYWDSNAWQEYQVGAGDSQVKNGGVEGWRWGEFGSDMQAATPILAAQRALNWLQKQQSANDGGYGNASTSVEAAFAIGANNLREAQWQSHDNAPSLLNFLKEKGKAYAKIGVAESGKFAMGQSAGDGCFPKRTKLPERYYNSNTGMYGADTSAQVYGILGTAALGQTIPADAVTVLKNLQQGNGGWEWMPGWGSDTNTTSLALQALIASGEANDSTAIVDGLAFLASAQNDDGGFPYDPNSAFSTDSDANSTAYAIQALIATGQDPTAGEWTKNANPIAFLLTLQKGNGSFAWQSGGAANILATEQAITALLSAPYPVRIDAHHVCK